MKRMLLLLLALLFAAQTAFAAVTTSDAVVILQGDTEKDVNRDGVTDADDAATVLSFLAGEITPEPITVSLTCDSADMVSGDTLSLSASVEGGFGTMRYRFSVVTGEGESVELASTEEASVCVSCETPCAGVLTVTVTDDADQSAVATAGNIVIRALKTASDGKFTYYLNDSGAVIRQWLDAEATGAVIPDVLDGAAVVKIGEGAFQNMTALACVTLPDTVSVIGKAAFKGCVSLKSMNTQD